MNDRPIGRRRWAIAEGYIPSSSTGPEPEMTSHETFCILNAGDQDAHVQITIYYTDREPAGPYHISASTTSPILSRFRVAPTTPA
jgi:hypothetical protein